MNKVQLQAGYFLDDLKEKLVKFKGQKKIDGLLKSLSHFNVYSVNPLPEDYNKNEEYPLYCVLDNIISRGFPTRPSIYIEDIIAEKLSLTRKEISKIGNINYPLLNADENFLSKVFNILHIIEPRISSKNHKFEFVKSFENLGSDFEEGFLFKSIPEYYGEFFIQLLESQRGFKTIIDKEGEFVKQNVDFSLEYPYDFEKCDKKGFVIEIDGSQHNEPLQKSHDRDRDNVLYENNWVCKRIKTNDFNNLKEILYDFAHQFSDEEAEYFKIVKNNYNNWEIDDLNFRLVLQIVFLPIAVARIEKLIIQLLKRGVLDIHAPKWKIAIFERDVPCANFAIDDLKSHLKNLFSLKGIERPLPEIELFILNTQEYENFELSKDFKRHNCEENHINFKCDILLDISIFERDLYRYVDNEIVNSLGNPQIYHLRSSPSIIPKNFKISSAAKIKYFPLIKDGGTEEKDLIQNQADSLIYFLQFVFRKEKFRPGQIEILNRALQLRNVIGLLPTGSGKSLCYQLSGILQPGVSLVVDPILSLMADQISNLNNIGIVHIAKINSELDALSKDKMINELIEGRYLFVFLAPERFQIQNYRDALIEMKNGNGIKIHQFVIDEAHCVSEWGHDFRPAYLSLGENARRFIAEDIVVFGLTGTASYDVLSDAAREVSVDTQGLIESQSFDRSELRFSIRPKRFSPLQSESGNKPDVLKDVLLKIPAFFRKTPEEFYAHNVSGEYENCGIIFCPHGGIEHNDKSPYCVGTVKDIVADTLQEYNSAIGVYSGKMETEEKVIEQDKFKNNKTQILISTIAFGMGVDKPNIRFIIHYNCSQSIESYYQEAGRAGRDRMKALCITIFSDDKLIIKKDERHNSFDFLDGYFNYKRLLNHFKKINPSNAELAKKLTKDKWNEFLTAEEKGICDYLIDYRNNIFQFGKISGNNSDKVYLNYSNKILNDVYSYSELKALKNKVHFSKANDIVRRLYFHNTNFPGLDEEMLVFKAIFETYIRPNQNQESILIPFSFSYNLKGHSLQLDDDPGHKNSNGYIEKGIYRLRIMGLISDYTKDYNAKRFTIFLNQYTDSSIIDQVKNYIGRYKSTSYTERVPLEIENTELIDTPEDLNEKILYKAVKYITKFIYEEIEKKRRNALREYIRILRIGSRNINRFREELEGYFNSKYARELTAFSKEYSIGLLWDYIDICANSKDNIRHLYGAAVRLLISYQDNLIFRLMRCYASFVHSGFDKSEAQEYFVSTFERCIGSPDLNHPDRILVGKWMDRFYDEVIEREPDAIKDLEIAFEKYHLNWAEKFNKEFIDYAI